MLWNDPASGVMRHADAGYEAAIDCAREKGLDLPSLGGNKIILPPFCGARRDTAVSARAR